MRQDQGHYRLGVLFLKLSDHLFLLSNICFFLPCNGSLKKNNRWTKKTPPQFEYTCGILAPLIIHVFVNTENDTRYQCLRPFQCIINAIFCLSLKISFPQIHIIQNYVHVFFLVFYWYNTLRCPRPIEITMNYNEL